MAKSVAQTVDRWKSGAAQGQQNYVSGIQNTQVDVAGRAIAAQQQLLSNFTESVTSGRWARGLTESGGTANWKAKSQAKAANYATGIAAGGDKYQNSMNKLIPFIEQTVNSLPPRQAGNMAVSLARVQGLMTALHGAKGQFKG